MQRKNISLRIISCIVALFALSSFNTGYAASSQKAQESYVESVYAAPIDYFNLSQNRTFHQYDNTGHFIHCKDTAAGFENNDSPNPLISGNLLEKCLTYAYIERVLTEFTNIISVSITLKMLTPHQFSSNRIAS